jgi:hypothetical protein
MENVGTYYGHLEYFVAIWSIVTSFGILIPVLVFFTKKNVATLVREKTKIVPDWLPRSAA